MPGTPTSRGYTTLSSSDASDIEQVNVSLTDINDDVDIIETDVATVTARVSDRVRGYSEDLTERTVGSGGSNGLVTLTADPTVTLTLPTTCVVEIVAEAQMHSDGTSKYAACVIELDGTVLTSHVNDQDDSGAAVSANVQVGMFSNDAAYASVPHRLGASPPPGFYGPIGVRTSAPTRIIVSSGAHTFKLRAGRNAATPAAAAWKNRKLGVRAADWS